MSAVDNLQPELKLFLSVDVINSTAYKNQKVKPGQVQPWLEFFKDFYTEFPIYLKRYCDDLKEHEELKQVICDPPPSIWKTLGDEIIFTFTLTDYKQARFLVIALKNALIQFNNDNKAKLQLKASAWIAGFPVGNAKIVSDKNNLREDYIGPLIDIGFRLSKFASQNFLIVSVDLSLLLVQDTEGAFAFHLLGKETLKGVLNHEGIPIEYPIIGVFVDKTPTGKQNKELYKSECALIKSTECKTDKLKDFCAKTIAVIGKPLMKPFILGDSVFSDKPKNYDEDYTEVCVMREQLDMPPKPKSIPKKRPGAPDNLKKKFDKNFSEMLEPIGKKKKK